MYTSIGLHNVGMDYGFLVLHTSIESSRIFALVSVTSSKFVTWLPWTGKNVKVIRLGELTYKGGTSLLYENLNYLPGEKLARVMAFLELTCESLMSGHYEGLRRSRRGLVRPLSFLIHIPTERTRIFTAIYTGDRRKLFEFWNTET